ncbi:RNA ligase family protein [Hugenholtzia roseola]|uniref:RNA ligase family protein n=1 Tax=Hugenholtzia roseola TaxID=1002 RepID=UPI00040C8695|nr:RNA ligase family protein [Hugenholtzia roseola]
MEPTFKPYEKIAEQPAEYPLTEAHYRQMQKATWVVTEKIHGANLAVIVEESRLFFAKRKMLLEKDDDFFGYFPLLDSKKAQFRTLYQQLKAEYPQLDTLQIYGELFGGNYPHPEVTPNQEVQAVQTGVYYSPDLQFCIFDILLHFENKRPSEYLPIKTLIENCRRVALLCTPILFEGKYKEAWEYSPLFSSHYPALFGLPPLAMPNYAEGIVLKPQHDLKLPNQAAFRPIFKRKIEAFAESRYHQAEKEPTFQPHDPTQKLLALLTPNRLQNAISKIGRVQKKNTAQIELLKRYLWEDIEAERQKFPKMPLEKRKTLDQTLTEAIEDAIAHFLKA